MLHRSAARALTFGILSGAAVVLASCNTTTGPLYGPNSPRNGAGDVVDPQLGTIIPGYPTGGEGEGTME